MPKRKPANLDGFVVRRRPNVTERHVSLGDDSLDNKYRIDPEYKNSSSPEPQLQQLAHDESQAQPMTVAGGQSGHKGSLTDSRGIDMSLGEIQPHTKKRRRFLKKPRRRTVVIFIVVLFLATIGYFGWKLFGNIANVFNGNPFSALFSNQELKKDQYGRTNILVFGTSEDDDGHDGAYLTDSMMIVSISQEKKDAYLLSVPRDLWVDYNEACSAGYSGKINAAYLCYAGGDSEGVPQDETAGQDRLRTLVGGVFGVDLQYSVHINYGVLQQAVDAVGGITVEIDSDDPRGVLDRNFDWKCPNGIPQSCYNVRYPNGPAELDGLHALYLARARGDDGRTYGLSGSNFDREKYQQKIMIALKDKATSAGTLANPISVTNLLDAMGDNVRTNIGSGEIRSFISVANSIQTNSFHQLTLVDKDNPLVITGNVGDQSIVRPVAGLENYSQIRSYVQSNISGDTSAQENASISVLNGTDIMGVAQKNANQLTEAGINVTNVSDAPSSDYVAHYTLYNLSNGSKPATLAKLQKQLGVTAQTSLPDGVTSDSDFVIIIGSDGAN